VPAASPLTFDAMRQDLSYSVQWTTDRFVYRGEIPEDYNAGNRFYGRDVAEFLCEQLRSDDLSTDFLDEDWGWLVLGKSTKGQFVEVAIYNLGDDGSEPRVGSPEWGLWVRMFEKRPWLVFFRRTYVIRCEQWFLERLKRIEMDAGIKAVPWVGGLADR